MSGENRGQVIGSYFASREIENRSWCIHSIGETMEERHESQIVHFCCGQGKACEVLKQQTREIDKEIKRKRLVDKQKQ